jgi:hypothetical protein
MSMWWALCAYLVWPCKNWDTTKSVLTKTNIGIYIYGNK